MDLFGYMMASGTSGSGGGGGSVTVDSALDYNSENPVQNKVITNVLPTNYMVDVTTGLTTTIGTTTSSIFITSTTVESYGNRVDMELFIGMYYMKSTDDEDLTHTPTPLMAGLPNLVSTGASGHFFNSCRFEGVESSSSIGLYSEGASILTMTPDEFKQLYLDCVTYSSINDEYTNWNAFSSKYYNNGGYFLIGRQYKLSVDCSTENVASNATALAEMNEDLTSYNLINSFMVLNFKNKSCTLDNLPEE